MINLLKDIEESMRERSGCSGYLAGIPENSDIPTSQRWLKVAGESKQAEVTSHYQPQVANGKRGKNADNSQLAILATTDVDELLRIICSEYGVPRDWLDQLVDAVDVQDLRNGDLPVSCLRAHIECRIEQQYIWRKN